MPLHDARPLAKVDRLLGIAGDCRHVRRRRHVEVLGAREDAEVRAFLQHNDVFACFYE